MLLSKKTAKHNAARNHEPAPVELVARLVWLLLFSGSDALTLSTTAPIERCFHGKAGDAAQPHKPCSSRHCICAGRCKPVNQKRHAKADDAPDKNSRSAKRFDHR